MKKYIYSLFAVLALSCTFVSCGDDDDDAVAPTGNPAVAAAGVYSGTWTITSDVDTVTTPGTLTFTPTDSIYTTDIAFNAEEVSIVYNITNAGVEQSSKLSLDLSSVANISYAGSNGFQFLNTSATNGLSTTFAGHIRDGVANTYFTIKQRAGRAQYTFTYNFTGTKQ